METQKYKGTLETEFNWIIPFLIGFSKSIVSEKYKIYSLHITPFFEIGLNLKK